MITEGEKKYLEHALELAEYIDRMMKVEGRWMNVQEFIRDAVNEKIERWNT